MTIIPQTFKKIKYFVNIYYPTFPTFSSCICHDLINWIYRVHVLLDLQITIFFIVNKKSFSAVVGYHIEKISVKV